MKYNIKKLQGGGFVTFTPILKQSNMQPTAPSGAAGNAEKSEQSSVLDQDLYKRLIMDGGLVSDVNVFVKQIESAEQQTPFGYLDSGNRSNSLRMFSKVNELRQNRENWKSAYDSAAKSDGLGEIAIGGNRELYVRDKTGNIKTVGISDFEKNRKDYNPLTVSQLLEARSKDERLAFDTSSFAVAEQSIGTSKIFNKINDIVSKMGDITSDKTTYVDTRELAKRISHEKGLPEPSKQVLEGLSDLRNAIDEGSEGIYKIKNKTVTPNIQKAYEYVWSSLTEQEKNKLMANGVMAGKKSTDISGIVQNAIYTQASPETEFTPEYQKEMTEDADGLGGSSKKTINLTPQELFHNDRLYIPGMKYEINTPNNKVSLKATATGIAPLFNLNKEGETIGAATISDVLSLGNYSSIINPKKAYIGDTNIDPLLLQEVAYTGEDVGKLYMPVNDNGAPDLGQLEKFNNAYEVFNINKNTWNDSEIKDHFRKAGFPGIKIKRIKGSDGVTTTILEETGKVKPFLALPIISNSASDLSNNPWMIEMTGDKKDLAKVLMEKAFSVQGGTQSKPKMINKMPTGTFSLETPYKGTLFIGYRPEAAAILSSTQQHLTGLAPTEVDLYRNLNNSTDAYRNINSSAIVLKNE